MEDYKIIAVTGKGGTGKTVLSTLMLQQLAERFPEKVLAIDADSAMSLPYTLNLKVEKTVSQLRKTIVGSRQFQSEHKDATSKDIMRDLLTNGKGFDLLAMGRPEEPGCFCAVNELLRFGIDSLSQDYDVTLIDGEAGPEQLNRRVVRTIDTLLVVSDMSARSLETAAGIIHAAKGEEGSQIQVRRAGLILNRVRDDQPIQELIDKTGLEVFGVLPEDPAVNKYDREGRSLFDLPADNACRKAVSDILKKIYPGF